MMNRLNALNVYLNIVFVLCTVSGYAQSNLFKNKDSLINEIEKALLSEISFYLNNEMYENHEGVSIYNNFRFLFENPYFLVDLENAFKILNDEKGIEFTNFYVVFYSPEMELLDVSFYIRAYDSISGEGKEYDSGGYILNNNNLKLYKHEESKFQAALNWSYYELKNQYQNFSTNKEEQVINGFYSWILVFNFDKSRLSTFSFKDFTSYPMLYFAKSIKYLNDIDIENKFKNFYYLIHGKL